MSDINKMKKGNQSALESRNSLFSEKVDNNDKLLDHYHRKVLSRDCLPTKPNNLNSSELINLSSSKNDIISFKSSIKP